jgi:hypothetical protein
VVEILQERRQHLVMTIEDPRLAIIVKRKPSRLLLSVSPIGGCTALFA